MPDAKLTSKVATRRTAVRSRAGTARATRAGATDSFFRDLVWGLRNGLIAVLADGTVTVMNDVAYQILGLEKRRSDIGKPFKDVLQNQPDVSRIVASAFELSHLPNRAEMRLKNTGKVIGYTLSQVRTAGGEITGAARKIGRASCRERV